MLLPFFTDTYPDELLYSACARYHRWTGNPNLKGTITELFGRETAIPSLYFGAALDKFCENLGGIYTPSKLIQENTLFPLYKPFLPKGRATEIETQMIYSDGNGLAAKIGAIAGAICKKNGICYCPNCVLEDKRVYGESYIHRLHQAQGINICPVHRCMLQQICLPSEASRLEYLDMERLQRKVSSGFLPDRKLKDILSMIAESATYLLTHDLGFADKHSVMMRYKQLLLRKGLLTVTGRVLQSDYLSSLQNFYNDDILRYLESEFCMEDEYAWPKVAVRNADRTVHPLRHILLIHFLDNSMEAFFHGIKNGDIFAVKREREARPVDDRLLEEYKLSILTTVNKESALPRAQLRKLIAKEYAYVYRRDKQWLMSHLPEPLRSKGRIGNVNWYHRDAEYCEKLRKAYDACVTDGGRITRTRLIRYAGIQANMENRREKLPFAWAYLVTVSQAVEEYQLARCMQIIRTYLGLNEILPKWKLIQRAGLTTERFIRIQDKLKQKITDERMGHFIDW